MAQVSPDIVAFTLKIGRELDSALCDVFATRGESSQPSSPAERIAMTLPAAVIERSKAPTARPETSQLRGGERLACAAGLVSVCALLYQVVLAMTPA